MQSQPDLSALSHNEKDELIPSPWLTVGQRQARISVLEDRLALNNSNSSKPSSSGGLSKPVPKSLHPSGQHGHSGSAWRQSGRPDHVLSHHSGPLWLHCLVKPCLG